MFVSMFVANENAYKSRVIESR